MEKPDIPPSAWRSTALRVAVLGFIWWGLNPGVIQSWIIGAPSVLLAAWVGQRLSARSFWHISVPGLLRFLPFFLSASFRGGIDVAWRSVHPRLPIDPRLVPHRSRLPEGTSLRFLIVVISLLPGTLVADAEGTTIKLHVLTDSPGLLQGVMETEKHVAGLFGVTLPDESGEA